MSSSRVQTTFTGPSTCLAIRTAWVYVVELQPAAEPAAQQMVVDHHFLRREAGDLRRHGLGPRQHLGAGPDLAAVLPDVDRAVHRLHGGVRQERHLVDGFHLSDRRRSARRRISLLPGHHARLPRGLRRAP